MIVKEHINEKFAEESDPIRDLGIGMLAKIEDYIIKKGRRELVNGKHYDSMFEICLSNNEYIFAKFLLDSKLVDINASHSKSYGYFLGNCAYDHNWKGCKFLIDNGADVKQTLKELRKRGLDETCNDLLMGIRKLKEKNILAEKFVEESDPIYDLGIGLPRQINDWIKEFTKRKVVEGGDFIINNDLTLDSKDDIDISYEDLSRLPSYIKFNYIRGRFACCFDNLRTIKINGPKIVDGDYVIFYNAAHGKPTFRTSVRKYCQIKGKLRFSAY